MLYAMCDIDLHIVTLNWGMVLVYIYIYIYIYRVWYLYVYVSIYIHLFINFTFENCQFLNKPPIAMLYIWNSEEAQYWYTIFNTFMQIIIV